MCACADFGGGVSVSALSAKRQLKNYAVFYVCGLKWKQCAVVNFFSSLIGITVSLILGIIAVLIIRSGETVTDLGFWQILGCIFIMAVYMMLSIILPLRVIGSNTPKEILSEN